MSLHRLNYLLMAEILPFNFGMDYQAWLEFYDKTTLRELCPTDPRSWSQETIDKVNRTAKDEKELADRLMALSDEEFYAEVERLKAVEEVKDK